MLRLFKLSNIKKLVNIFLDFFYDIKHFWFQIAYYSILSKFSRLPIFPQKTKNKIQDRKTSLIFNFLNSKYSDFIREYRDKPLEEWINSKKIWTCRRQWEKYAPDLVKLCLNSIRKRKWDYELIIIDQHNFSQYIDIPDFILKKVKNKDISLTHLSDIIRMWLLKKYWWIRVDATMFFNQNIFKYFDNMNINSNYPKLHIEKNHEFTKRTWFFIWWKSNNRTFSFVYDFFIQYHKDYRRLIDFFLIDYAIYLAYKNFSDSKKDIDNISLQNNEIFNLVLIFNDPYNQKIYDKIMENWFFKLTYKMKFFISKNWEFTNYWNFIKEYNQNYKNY